MIFCINHCFLNIEMLLYCCKPTQHVYYTLKWREAVVRVNSVYTSKLLIVFTHWPIKVVYQKISWNKAMQRWKDAVRRFVKLNFPSKHLLVLKTSWKSLQDMSWRHLQHVFSVTMLRLPRRLEDVLKTSCKTSWKTKNCYAEDVLKTSWRHVLKTSWRHVLKTSWRCLEDMSWRPLKDFMETNKILTGGYLYTYLGI